MNLWVYVNINIACFFPSALFGLQDHGQRHQWSTLFPLPCVLCKHSSCTISDVNSTALSWSVFHLVSCHLYIPPGCGCRGYWP